MNSLESEALYKEALEFSKEDKSVAGAAARELAEVLAERMRSIKFNSGIFIEDCISFLTIKADKLNNLDKSLITGFLQKCSENTAIDLIERFVDICTMPSFNVTVTRLSFLAEQLADNGFKEEGARCFQRAKELILQDAEASPAFEQEIPGEK